MPSEHVPCSLAQRCRAIIAAREVAQVTTRPLRLRKRPLANADQPGLTRQPFTPRQVHTGESFASAITVPLKTLRRFRREQASKVQARQ
jgi:hypothetical protein